MRTSRLFRIGLPVLVLTCTAWVSLAQNKLEIPAKQSTDPRNSALRDLARLVAADAVHKLHWSKLETSENITQLIEQLANDVGADQLSFRWNIRVISAAKAKDRGEVLDDFERLAVAAVQGGEDEASLIGGDPVLRFARAIRLKSSCMSCHMAGPPDPIKENDVIGIVVVSANSR